MTTWGACTAFGVQHQQQRLPPTCHIAASSPPPRPSGRLLSPSITPVCAGKRASDRTVSRRQSAEDAASPRVRRQPIITRGSSWKLGRTRVVQAAVPIEFARQNASSCTCFRWICEALRARLYLERIMLAAQTTSSTRSAHGAGG
jgi:hypothetical protein